MKQFFVIIFLLCSLPLFAFEPLYYSLEKHAISKTKNSNSDLYTIDVSDLDDCEDIEENVKIRNKTNHTIEKISIYTTGESVSKRSDSSSFSTKVTGVDEFGGLVLLGTVKKIAPGKLRWWRTRFDDEILTGVRFIILSVDKPEGLEFKISEAKESFSDLMITIE
ncbi:MAG: hypothetical protein IKN82_09435 [Treponema sp.]|nr:hypothetical protein [Treponema sp.]